MARIQEVTEVDDPRVDDFRDLATADRRPDRPGGRGLVIAEGRLVVERLLASPYPIRALLGVRKRIDQLAEVIADLDVPAYVADAEVMARVVGFHLNRGVLAVADRVPERDPARLAATASKLIVLEGVVDHENLGALFRNAAAFGIDGVLFGRGCSDPLYRRSIRVSMGYVLHVPFATLQSWPDDLRLLRDNGFRLAALTPREGAVPLPQAGLERAPAAMVVGSEGPGLTERAIAACDVSVRIPMVDGVDSLNVATATAIGCYAMSGGTCPHR